MAVSIIIPTLNEAAALPATLNNLKALTPPPLDIIVADAGSGDETVAIATAAGVRVLTDLPKGRAGQMNAGVAAAQGDLLCFVHGDTVVTADFVPLVQSDLADFEPIGGWDPEQAIMEEADLCLRMVRAGRGRVRRVLRKVWSSDRRVAEWGFWRANLTYLSIGLKWGFEAQPARLAERYEDVR